MRSNVVVREGSESYSTRELSAEIPITDTLEFKFWRPLCSDVRVAVREVCLDLHPLTGQPEQGLQAREQPIG